MLELSNQGPWTAGLYPGFQLNQEFQWTCVIKAGFKYDSKGSLTPLDEQPVIEETDRHYGKPLETSLEVANEIAPFKSGGEIYLTGTVEPKVSDARMMEVALGINFNDGNVWQKVLRLYGQRKWKGTRFTPLISSPEIIDSIPLRYEFSYGGVDPFNKQDEYGLNCVGTGFLKDPLKAIGQPLPQIEIGPKFIKSPNTKATPACFSPIPVFWSPRKEDAGTLDEEAAKAGLCPFSDDLEARFYNCAPPDQRFEKPFVAGDEIILTGLHNDLATKEQLKITIPETNLGIWLFAGGKQEELDPGLDTIVIDADQCRMSLIYRVAIPMGRTNRNRDWIIIRDKVQEKAA